MRTLRELNTLLCQYPLRAFNDYGNVPEDIDAFRGRLAQKIDAFRKSRGDEEFDEDEPAEPPSGEE